MFKWNLSLRRSTRWFNLATLTLMLAFSLAASHPAFAVTYTNIWNYGDETDAASCGGAGGRGVIADSVGNLFGSCIYTPDGINFFGAIYELSPPATTGAPWTKAIVWDFAAPDTDSSIIEKAGNLFGAMPDGGAFGFGSVFELSPPATVGGAWNETTIWDFAGGTTDGAHPNIVRSDMAADILGNLYGVTGGGGSSGAGTVFKLSPPTTMGSPWTETILLNSQLNAPLLVDNAGNVYGSGGPDPGAVFELSPPASGSGPWTETTLWTFGKGSDGKNPVGGMVIDAKGNLYGLAKAGGKYQHGAIFKLQPPSKQRHRWRESRIWSFGKPKTIDAASFWAGLTMDPAGNLYGDSYNGGPAGAGTVFELSPTKTSKWKESILWSFVAGSDSVQPTTPLTLDAAGNIYGTTLVLSPPTLNGTAFEISP